MTLLTRSEPQSQILESSALPASHVVDADEALTRPLVVDLDGTLVRTDLLIESFLALLGRKPGSALQALLALRNGKAAFKSALAEDVALDMATLPFNQDVLAFVAAERRRGRAVYLASAADKRYVNEIAEHLGLFAGVFGSEHGTNLSGRQKADALCAAFGERGFDYVGDTTADEPVWRRSAGVFLADAREGHLSALQRWAPHAEAIGRRRSFIRDGAWLDYVKAMRLHQWLKNLLILVPALAAHRFDAALFGSVLAFVSFSLCASSVYILNDLLDLGSDRAHARKRRRPFAAGRLPLVGGAMLVPVLLAISGGIALLLPAKFLLVIGGYYALTCAYSFSLKRKMLVDVVALACLYGTRLLAGSAATGIVLSPWLGALSIFLFFCLALVKRCAELADRKANGGGAVAGRGYTSDDLPALQAMSAASGFVAVLVFALYVDSPAVRVLYSHPDRLWIISVLILYWVSRMLLLTHRGHMHDDPVVFAAKDRVSLMIAAGCAVVMAASI